MGRENLNEKCKQRWNRIISLLLGMARPKFKGFYQLKLYLLGNWQFGEQIRGAFPNYQGYEQKQKIVSLWIRGNFDSNL